MQLVFSKKELEDFLCQSNNLQKYLNLIFVARQVKIQPIGIVDILAFDWDSKSWVIIELKKNQLDSYALAQGLSYLNYYKSTSNYKTYQINSPARKFKLLLIGNWLDASLEKVVKHYPCIVDDCDIYYTLFSFNLKTGISFDFLNKGQELIENELNDFFEIKQSQKIQFNGINYFGGRSNLF